jgi:hypothetical protein
MQEGENIAGGMSYRTMNGIKTTKIMDYLEDFDDDSSKEILEKNKDYYIASANKTISRLDLAKKRVEYASLEKKTELIICEKISRALYWLEELKECILIKNNSKFLEVNQYKKWHAVKLIPSAAEGIIITSLIKGQLDNFVKNYNESNIILVSARQHIEKAEVIFHDLLNLNEYSDFKEAEKLRIKGYNEAVIADEKLKNLTDTI